MTAYRVGVDVGGTFTDIVLLAGDGTLITRKVWSSVDMPLSHRGAIYSPCNPSNSAEISASFGPAQEAGAALCRYSAAKPMGRTASAPPGDASFAPCGRTGGSAVSGA